MCTCKNLSRMLIVKQNVHWQKLWEDRERGKENVLQFPQNENVFVKIGESFANFNKNILILRKLGEVFCLFLMIFSRFLSVYVFIYFFVGGLKCVLGMSWCLYLSQNEYTSLSIIFRYCVFAWQVIVLMCTCSLGKIVRTFWKKSVFFSKIGNFFLNMSIFSQIGEFLRQVEKKGSFWEEKNLNLGEKDRFSHHFSQCKDWKQCLYID